MIALFAFLLTLGVVPSCRDTPALHERFQKIYGSISAAALRNDYQKLRAYLAPDFVAHTTSGQTLHYQDLVRFQKMNALATRRVLSYSETILAFLNISSETAAVIVLQRDHRIKTSAAGKPSDVSSSVVQKEVWKGANGTWRLTEVDEILSGPTVVDGKVYAG